MKNTKVLFILFVIPALLLSITACNKHNNSTPNSIIPGNPLASVEDNVQPITPEEIQRLMPPEFFLDPDGDGSIATNTYWLNSQAHPASIRKFSSIRAGVGSGKKILFYTRLNSQWVNFTTDLRQMLSDMGYTVEVADTDNPLPDLSTVDVLVIIDCIGTPFSSPNDRPMSPSDKTKIQNFVSSGKGFFFTGDWNNSELPKFNDISGIFGVTMALQYIDYIVTGRPPVTYYVPYWWAYVFDYINYYSTNPSQPILKKELLYGYSCFSNPTHEIFKDVNSVLVMGSSFVKPRVPALAAIRTHPTTSRPRDYPIVPEGYPIILANEYGSGRYVISCDSNAFANDGLATSMLAGTDNTQFAKNIFNWLAKASAVEGNLKIMNPHNNDLFDFGQAINFIGSQTGNITNIEWVSSIDGIFANDTLSFSKSNLSPGTHTITLRGIIGGPPASIRSGPSAQIRAANVGDPVSDSISIVVKETKPDIKIVGLDFLSGSGLNNRNRLYDRKQIFKTAPVGQKFLEPTQWAGTMDSGTGSVSQSINWPICYVRDGAPSLTNSSKIMLSVTINDFKATPNPGPIEVEASGTFYCEGGVQQPFVFSATTATPTAWPFSFTIESSTAVPSIAGQWGLEINWCFRKSGQILSVQRTPNAPDFHKVFITWDRTLVSGNFKVGDPTPGGVKAESLPTEYLEIASFSASFLNGHSSTATKDDIIGLIFDNAFNLGSKPPSERLSYSKDSVVPSTSPRGIDRLLDLKDGWCAEWGYFLKAILEHNGLDFKQRGYGLKSTYMDGTHAIVADGSILAVGGIKSTDLTLPKFAWLFGNHVTTVEILGSVIAFDPTFHRTGQFVGYANDLFDFYENVTVSSGNLVDVNILPDYAEISEELE